MTQATLSGFHHVTLNVRDVAKSERWYTEVLGFTPVTNYATDSFAWVIMRHPGSGAVIGLNRHVGPIGDEPFDERRAGLDHLALQVPDLETLEAWITRFDESEVKHSEIRAAAVSGAFLVVFRDPDNIQLEMFAPSRP